MNELRTLIFDLDDTLFDIAVPLLNAMRQVFGDKNLEITDECFSLFCKRKEERFAESQSGIITMEEMYNYRISMTMKDMGVEITEEEAALFQKIYIDCQNHIKLSPVMCEILTYCNQQGIQLAVLSNGQIEHQMDKVSILGLTEYIPLNRIFISGELKYDKPDRRAFTTVLERLGLPIPDENGERENQIYYVGDSYPNDVIGAKGAGLKTIWFNHRGHPEDHEVKPDITVHSEEELLDAIVAIVQSSDTE